MPPAVKEVTLQPTLMDETAPTTGLQRKEDAPPVPATHGNDLVLMFERLATNPDVNVEKLERLIAMQERIMAHNAKAAFDAAFAAMQPDIPEIDEKGRILVRGELQSTYARNEDMQKVLRPILAKHGFSLSFETQWPDKQTVKVFGILSHREGHSRRSEFLSDADTSGNKNAIQALGSAVSYGHRYTTKDLLNITSRAASERDDDGGSSEKFKAPAPPDKYDDWKVDMEAKADEGLKALQVAWTNSAGAFKNYVSKHDRQWYEQLKVKAGKVAAS
jgi:hypothetical protein